MKIFYSVWTPDGPKYYQESRRRMATHRALDMVRKPNAPINIDDFMKLQTAKLLDEKFDILLKTAMIDELSFS